LALSDLTRALSGPESVVGFGGIGIWLTGGGTA
jgi:hypothetical protein